MICVRSIPCTLYIYLNKDWDKDWVPFQTSPPYNLAPLYREEKATLSNVNLWFQCWDLHPVWRNSLRSGLCRLHHQHHDGARLEGSPEPDGAVPAALPALQRGRPNPSPGTREQKRSSASFKIRRLQSFVYCISRYHRTHWEYYSQIRYIKSWLGWMTRTLCFAVDGRGGPAPGAGGTTHPDPPALQGPGTEGEPAVLPLYLLQGGRLARWDGRLEYH